MGHSVDALLQIGLTLLLLALLFCKHFLVDFVFQTAYHYKNKGTYGHPGGIVHALEQFVGSLVVLLPVVGFSPIVWYICLADGFVHYHIDWAKVKINNKMKWESNTSSAFWVLMGFDQFLHQATYLVMVSFLLPI